jgi:hypothetical protein
LGKILPEEILKYCSSFRGKDIFLAGGIFWESIF